LAVILSVLVGFLAFTPVERSVEVIRVTSPYGRLDFTLVNRTGYTLDRIHVKESNSKNWGGNILEGDLEDGYQTKVTFNATATADIWDLKVHYKGYDESSINSPVWTNIDLTKYNQLTLHWDAAKGVSTITKELVKQ
jgi:hypothetical protein